ncbi:MAG: hypothetical protein IK107_01445 [Oscillospiraceae bacterium]|nr:hypothetical protein [Oscillospiraceae bacterium]
MRRFKTVSLPLALICALTLTGCGKKAPQRDTSHDLEDAKQALYKYVACENVAQLADCVYEADLAAKLLENRALDGLRFSPGPVSPDDLNILSVEEIPPENYEGFQTLFAFAAVAAGVDEIRPFTVDAGYYFTVRGDCTPEGYHFQTTDTVAVIRIAEEGWRIGNIHIGDGYDIRVIQDESETNSDENALE